MKSSVVHKPHSVCILTVKITKGEMEHFTEHALDDLRKQVKVDGFREGRVPNDILINKVGQTVVDGEALQHALGDTYFLAVQEHKLQPVENPKIDVKSHITAPDPKADDETVVVEYTATVSVLPEVKLPNLDKLAVERKEIAPATEEEIEKVTTHLRRQKAMFKELERPAAMGDWVDIGYVGSIGGVEKDGMKNEHHPIVLGEGNLIPGFEENVVGMKQGETKTFSVNFPKEYHSKEAAGKRAEFTVTVHEIKEVVLPPYDKEFTTAFGFDDPEKMRAAIAENLKEERVEEEQNRVREEVLSQLDKHLKMDVPESLFDQEIDRMVADLKKQVEQSKMEWEQYLTQIKHTEDELRKEMRPQAEKHVRIGLALGAVVKENDLKVPDEKQAAVIAIDWLVEKATSKK